MTLVEKLINEHNQAVQYAKESLEKDGFLSGIADSEIAKQAERTLLAKLQELEKEYLKQGEQP